MKKTLLFTRREEAEDFTKYWFNHTFISRDRIKYLKWVDDHIKYNPYLDKYELRLTVQGEYHECKDIGYDEDELQEELFAH